MVGTMQAGIALGEGMVRRTREGWATCRRNLLLAVPLLAAVFFVRVYSTAMPVTDEWFFLRRVVALQNVDLHSREGIATTIDMIPARFNEHLVVIPFLVYWPVSQWAHFDSRWFIYITLFVFAIEALLFRRYLVQSAIWAFPIVLLLFCPSHYMEFLWGWQFTLAFSIVFALAGLFVLDHMPIAGSWRRQCGYVLASLLLCLLATLSSSGGFLGFPCAVLLLALKPLGKRAKATWSCVFTLAGTAAYLDLMHDPGRKLALGVKQVVHVLTAFGGTIWGSPVGLFEFGFDFRSLTGLVIVVSTIVVVARAWRIGALPRLALALSVTVYGLLCMASIAMSREYLGNWHLQYALPAVCGAYAAGYLLWKEDKSAFSAVPFFTLLLVLMSCLFGYYKGFVEYGPEYNARIRAIEDHARNDLAHPGRPKPYPGEWHLGTEMLLFLSAHGHPLFEDAPQPMVLRPLPAAARIFVDQKEVALPFSILTDRGKLMLLTVALPDGVPSSGVVARIGSSTLVLRRVHPTNSKLPCCRDAGVVCFCGLIVPSLIEAGAQPVQVSLFD